MMSAGYSRTPLAGKLGYAPGQRVFVDNAPDGYAALVAPLPEGVKLLKRAGDGLDMAHGFFRERRRLAAALPRYMAAIRPDGAIWISWPKKASKVETDITEDVVRALALPLGLVDVKVCAVDDVWSGLKLVIRKSRR